VGLSAHDADDSEEKRRRTEMTSTHSTARRELAYRISDGIEVTLFWSKPSTRVTVAVLDTRRDEALEFEVDGSAALDAFNHPYAYAAGGQAHNLSTARLLARPVSVAVDY
jgi:hypothetical protein